LLINALNATPGILHVELDQLVSLVGGINTLNHYPERSLRHNSRLLLRQSGLETVTPISPPPKSFASPRRRILFKVSGIGIVADIDTGVDPNHPALQAVLLPGYDFTRNQPNGSEVTDFTQPPPSGNPPAPAQVNQSTAAVLDQSTAAVLDGNAAYAAFGHGTMVLGVIHLVAPNAHLLPLKAFRADGSAKPFRHVDDVGVMLRGV